MISHLEPDHAYNVGLLADKFPDMKLVGNSKTFDMLNQFFDIDIEIFDKIKVSSSNLEIPHPRLKERAFVLIPILEIFEECADFIDRDEFVFWLKQLDVSDVEKILPKEEFLKKFI